MNCTLILAMLLSVATSAEPELSADTPSSENSESSNVKGSQAMFGSLSIDAKQSVELYVDGEKVALLYRPGHFSLRLESGPHDLLAFVSGNPHKLSLNVLPNKDTYVMMGRTGIVVQDKTDRPATTGPSDVTFRANGTESILLVLGKKRHKMEPGSELTLTMEQGMHPLSLRNGDSTVIWATGKLNIAPGDEVVVQLGEGRAPEISTGRSTYVTGG